MNRLVTNLPFAVKLPNNFYKPSVAGVIGRWYDNQKVRYTSNKKSEGKTLLTLFKCKAYTYWIYQRLKTR